MVTGAAASSSDPPQPTASSATTARIPAPNAARPFRPPMVLARDEDWWPAIPPLEDWLRSVSEQVDIRRLDVREVRTQLDGLASVLVDCVEGGASVSYMAPFSHADARDAFEGWAADVEQRHPDHPRGVRRRRRSSARCR